MCELSRSPARREERGVLLLDLFTVGDELPALDAEAFDAAEAVIEGGQKAFVEVGEAIMAIRDAGRAERERRGYATFEAYMQRRWGWSRRRGYQLIAAAEVARNIAQCEPMVHKPVELPNERQARPLAPLTPDAQRATWAEAVRLRPDGKPRVADLQRLARETSAEDKAERRAQRLATEQEALAALPPEPEEPAVPTAHRLFRGDCLEVLPTLPADSVQLVLTSPPYNVKWRYGADDGSGDDLPLPVYHDLLAQAIAESWRVLRPGGVLALNLPQTIRTATGDPRVERNHAIAAWALTHVESGPWLLREPLIWLKAKDEVSAHADGTAIGAANNPTLRPTHELWIIASKGTYQLPGKTARWPGSADDFGSYLELMKDVWPHRPGRALEGEPLAWPPAMIDPLIWTYSSEGDVVLDPFAGNGSAGASAIRQGRIAWLIEREPLFWPRLEVVLGVLL